MKRLVLLGALVLILTGCTSINDSSLDTLIGESLESKVTTNNISRKGYSYYLPKGVSISYSDNLNEVITNKLYNYYLYVDIVSYNSKVEFNYNENKEAYYSKKLAYNGEKGYIEINNYKNDQYLIEIMYNYAKIEVVVYEHDIKETVTYAMTILTSITYNDNVISNYLSSTEFDFIEENFDIFEIVGSDNYLQFTEEDTSEEEVRDPDYVN